MGLLQCLALISFSIFPILSNRLSVDPRILDKSVVIRGLAPPESTLTLPKESILRILKSDDENGKCEIWQLQDVEVKNKQHRAEMVFKKVDLNANTKNEYWTDRKLADQILLKHVYILKSSVSTRHSTNDESLIIRGLSSPQSQIELKKGSTLRINGKETSIKSIKSSLFNQILFGLVEYKIGQQWHKLQPKYELINPSETALKMKEYDDSDPKRGFPKKHEMIHCMFPLSEPQNQYLCTES